MDLNKEQKSSYYFELIHKYVISCKNQFTYEQMLSDIINNEFKKLIHNDEKTIIDAIKFWFYNDTYGFKKFCKPTQIIKKKQYYIFINE